MSLRSAASAVRGSGWWRPASAALIARSYARSRDPLPSDIESLSGAARWIARAQDATGDGGIAGRYRLAGGWSSSYPETTGYSIPTLLALARALGDDSFVDRAKCAVEFLLRVQLASGAFPALEIADNRTVPSPFNTAQIVHGLRKWHEHAKDDRALDAAMRAARWVCGVQDDDGAWRQYFYKNVASSYSAHAACWIAELGAYTGEETFKACARRNLEWVLGQRDPETGWIDLAGFSQADHAARRAHTHTIAYTLWGVLTMSQLLESAEGVDAVAAAAERVLARLERSRRLAGVLDHRWRPAARYVCLTGNAQMALVWLRLYQHSRDARLVNAAFKAIDDVKRAQASSSPHPDIRGGVPGSDPIGGAYVPFALPNWAAKFLVDALLAKRDCLAALDARPPARAPLPADVPFTIRATSRADRSAARPVVVYTTRLSPKFQRLAELWAARGFTPALVIVERAGRGAAVRLLDRLRRRPDDAACICRRQGIPYVSVASIDSHDAAAQAARVAPFVAVHAGAGILRAELLAVPRLGTLNAHMGILPFYRGMNVAEWAAFNSDDVGCSVHWIDAGIDTGPIVCVRRVDAAGCRGVDDLRARVDAAQLALLDDILRAIVDEGLVPEARPQAVHEGRQFYRLHPELRSMLDRDLAIPDS